MWIGFLIWLDELGATAIAILIGFYVILVASYAFLLWKLRDDGTRRRSRTKSETTIAVQAPYDVAFAKCNDAVLRLKARIISLDYDNGIIESERQSVWRVPFILNVKISRLDAERCSIHVESDTTLHTTLLDFGMNSRRVTRFVRALVQ